MRWVLKNIIGWFNPMLKLTFLKIIHTSMGICINFGKHYLHRFDICVRRSIYCWSFS